ncbi:hypothetical protein DEJ73_02040 [Chromohalobacter salexigens]|nr:hypothetical protein [Chromohalobacter salexigens]
MNETSQDKDRETIKYVIGMQVRNHMDTYHGEKTWQRIIEQMPPEVVARELSIALTGLASERQCGCRRCGHGR